MATPVAPAHHPAACPQAFHPYIQPQQQQQQQQHPHPHQSWPDHFMMHGAPPPQSPVDEASPAKLDHHQRYPYRAEWSAAMRPPPQHHHHQAPGFHGYPTSSGSDVFQHTAATANEIPTSSAAPFSYISTATPAASTTLTIPSPPPSDGSPRAEWAAFAHSEADSAVQAGSLPFNRNSPVQRSDGVRKKNAKFEIPVERNLDTLDDMIKGAKTDTERKELKMQKRLLRNREAALHSRQKKKNYTERLERENTTLVTKIREMQHNITTLIVQADDFAQEREALKRQVAEAEEQAHRLQHEKDGHARERAQMVSEIEQLRARMRGPTSRSPAGMVQSDSAPLGSEQGVEFGVDGWHEPGFEMMSELYLEPGKLQGRTEDAKSSVVVH